MDDVVIDILPNGKDLEVPTYATVGSAGVDLRSAEDKVIKAGRVVAVRTGIALKIPEGYEGQVRPRSGLAKNYYLTVFNSPGTIDSDYRGEIAVLLFNASPNDYKVSKGDRIAQLVFNKVERVGFKFGTVSQDTDRSSGGFGSTGVK